MSWLFSQALVEEYSAGTSSDGEPCAQLNVMPTRRPFWHRGKMMDASSLSQFGLTSKLLMAYHGEDLLTWFREDSLAKTSVRPVPEVESKESAPASGQKWRGSFAKYDQDSCLWRTAQCSLLGGLERFSGTWPTWGSMHDGECSAHTTPGWVTCGNVSGLWPTPTASDEKGSVTPQTAKKRAAKSSRGVRLPEFLTLKGLLPGGRHNPEFSEWLMGWPLQWTAIEPLETAKFREWQQQHGGF
jgi:hypothetical protein